MNWNKNPNRHVAAEADILSSYPTGGWVKLSLLGVILPGYIIYYAVMAWSNESAFWLGRGGGAEVIGDTAKSLAVGYASVALFCHFRWFWGLLDKYRVHEVGSIISLVAFCGGLLMAVIYTFFV